MPSVGNTIIYTASVYPNIAESYLWSISGGGTINGSTTGASVSVTWTAAGTHTVYLQAINDCSTVPTSKSVCVEGWINFSPETVRCGANSEVQLDPCNQYLKQIETCTNNTRWIFHSTNSACEECVSTYTNTIAGEHESTINYYKSCAEGCTTEPIPYRAYSLVAIGSVSANSVAEANQNAIDQAVANVNADQAANGQNNANSEGECTCGCVTTSWTSTGASRCNEGVSEIFQGSDQCVGVTRWITGGSACCTESWTPTGTTACGNDIPGGATIIGESVDTCWRYREESNQCNSNTRWVAASNDKCNCTPCLFTPVVDDIPGSEYCDGTDCRIETEDECGNTSSRLVEADCTACQCVPNWVAISGSNTCGQDVATHPTYPQSGLDVCYVYLREEDGCGNSRWTQAFSALGCPGCCDLAGEITVASPLPIYVNTAGGVAVFRFPTVTGGGGSYSYSWSASIISGGSNASIGSTLSAVDYPDDFRVFLNNESTGSATLRVECTVTDTVSGCFIDRSEDVEIDVTN